jgi:23S rRNA pseudouridine1911/1915/1917 synthase
MIVRHFSAGALRRSLSGFTIAHADAEALCYGGLHLSGRQHQFVVRRAEAGRTVVEFLGGRLRLTSVEAIRLLRLRGVWVNGRPCVEPKRRLPTGQRVRVSLPKQEAPPAKKLAWSGACQPVIRYLDAQVVVVEKPTGLTTMRHAEEAAEFGGRARRFLPATLADLLPRLLTQKQPRAPTSVRAVHRLDKETSGLVVFARTAAAERDLGKQFRAHTIERSYLAVVRGRPAEGRIESWIVRDRGDGRRGSSSKAGVGQRAVTHVRVLEILGAYTLVECRLETGRTHQVRIHLADAGAPLCGERIYDRPVHGKPTPDGSGCQRVALHAASLGFHHRTTRKRLQWTSPLPADLRQLVARLRKGRARAQRDAGGGPEGGTG